MQQEQYSAWYEQSVTDPEKFWANSANKWLKLAKTWDSVQNCDFNEPHIEWFLGAKLNATVNCLDKHSNQIQDKVAIYWLSEDLTTTIKVTYRELLNRVCKIANLLTKLGVNSGDRVCLYLPMLVDSIACMLACARIGAIHTVVFAGFSAKSLADRIMASNSKVIITADYARRSNKLIDLKSITDEALSLINTDFVKNILVIKNSDQKLKLNSSCELDFNQELQKLDSQENCKPAIVDSNHPLFILYTSGSTGSPKGIMHSTMGYLLYTAMSFKYVFDYQDNDIFWCTADLGWITGHSYGVYGPLMNGASMVVYEGNPAGPDPSLIWKIVDQLKVNILYTAPTLIRSLMKHGDLPLQNSSRDSLRILGTVGEPINPAAWDWYAQKVGNNNCKVVDTYWQTETGGIILAPIPNVSKQQPGSAGLPFFGIKPKIMSENKETSPNKTGDLVIESSWPGQMLGVYNDPARLKETYFSQYPGFYATGDGAFIDEAGEYWVTGRTDDVLNISGHRIGTAEVESALVSHPLVAEAAVVDIPDDIKGQALYAFVSLVDKTEFSDDIAKSLNELVAKNIGKFAKCNTIQLARDLPKTRSGKIMRRILRKVAQNDPTDLGDLSTLVAKDVVDDLFTMRKKILAGKK